MITDLFIDSYGEIDFSIKENDEAISSQLGVFLSIRATDGYYDGELEFDTFQGLDFDFLLSNDTDLNTKTFYLVDQIKKYYPGISDIQNVVFSEKKETRELKITFDYKTVYSKDFQRKEVLSIV